MGVDGNVKKKKDIAVERGKRKCRKKRIKGR